MAYKKYEEMDLNEVAEKAASGDVPAIEFIVYKFGNFIKSKARSYFLLGAENDDLIQEGNIGLIKAIRDYQNDRNASFKTFAELCINRQIITAVKMATRKKHSPLNSYISIYKEIGDNEGGERYLLDEIESPTAEDPVEEMIKEEERKGVSDTLHSLLSDFEISVLQGYIDGQSYQQMAENLCRSQKSIDNALQRIKKKIVLTGISLD